MRVIDPGKIYTRTLSYLTKENCILKKQQLQIIGSRGHKEEQDILSILSHYDKIMLKNEDELMKKE